MDGRPLQREVAHFARVERGRLIFLALLPDDLDLLLVSRMICHVVRMIRVHQLLTLYISLFLHISVRKDQITASSPRHFSRWDRRTVRNQGLGQHLGRPLSLDWWRKHSVLGSKTFKSMRQNAPKKCTSQLLLVLIFPKNPGLELINYW